MARAAVQTRVLTLYAPRRNRQRTRSRGRGCPATDTTDVTAAVTVPVAVTAAVSDVNAAVSFVAGAIPVVQSACTAGTMSTTAGHTVHRTDPVAFSYVSMKGPNRGAAGRQRFFGPVQSGIRRRGCHRRPLVLAVLVVRVSKVVGQTR